ncbi:uncharacterized protein LOC111271206 isoform X1 [Varroa jacobsoni]|uniref:Uncharacterized protein n=2 Tax=Varroa destructor TaxID=109461 RepID=A0A7M7KC22_VARDE|nr:uncharacterized protein LOC111251331 isoform X1 [Varroa destructor]XP_022707604.1 uncharacterized protein LOC111271206 isoform X1 [Varroa jacobsoni]
MDMADSSISATGRGLPTFMLDQEQLVAKAFDKLGLGSLPKESVHRNPLQAMECLARICIAIIGEHCQDIIAISQERSKSIEEEFESDAAEREIANLDTKLEALRSKYRRLLAQREVHNATDLACQRVSDVLNQAARSLLKAAPLVAVAGFMEDRVRALQRIPMPQTTRQKCGEPPSLCSTAQALGCIDDVARFSIQESTRNYVYDYADGERAIDYVSKAFTDFAARLKEVDTPQANANLSTTCLNALAHAHSIKKLTKKITGLGNTCENLTQSEVENILKQCQEIIRSRLSKLKEANVQGIPEVDDSYELMTLRDRQSAAITALASQINDNEALEEQMQLLRDELYVSQKLRSFDSLLNMMRSQKSLLQSTKNDRTLVPRSFRPTVNLFDSALRSISELKLLSETIRAYDLEVQLESNDNRAVLEYLASLERSVDTSKLTVSPLATNTAESLLEELQSFSVLRLAKGTSDL